MGTTKGPTCEVDWNALGEMLERKQLKQIEHLALSQRRQLALAILVLLAFIQADIINSQEAGKL